MSRPVQVCFDAIAERWEIGYADALGTTVPLPADDVIRVGRSVDGRVVEVVVDSVVVPTDGVAFIADNFGPAVAEVIHRAVPGTDLDVTITTHLPERATVATTAVMGEPGVPHRRGADRYAVPLPQGDVELRVTRGELRLRLPADLGTGDWWIRVGHVETGDLLALAPVRRDDPMAPQATLSFGLALPPEQLHVTITDRPLAVVGTRHERRVQWIDRLLIEASTVRRTRPRLAARLARTARQVAVLIDDADRRRTADRLLGRSRRFGLGSMGAVTLLVIVVAGVLLAGRGSAPAPAPTSVPVSASEPVPDLRPGSVGPATFTFDDQTVIDATLIGRLPDASPGEVVPVTVEVTSTLRWSFGPAPGAQVTDEAAVIDDARRNCLGVTDLSGEGANVRFPPYLFTIRMARPDPKGADVLDQFIVGSYEASPDVLSYSTIKDSCRSPEFGAANRFEADTVVRRTPQVIDVPLPPNMPAGLWELRVETSAELVQQNTALRLRVTP